MESTVKIAPHPARLGEKVETAADDRVAAEKDRDRRVESCLGERPPARIGDRVRPQEVAREAIGGTREDSVFGKERSCVDHGAIARVRKAPEELVDAVLGDRLANERNVCVRAGAHPAAFDCPARATGNLRLDAGPRPWADSSEEVDESRSIGELIEQARQERMRHVEGLDECPDRRSAAAARSKDKKIRRGVDVELRLRVGEAPNRELQRWRGRDRADCRLREGRFRAAPEDERLRRSHKSRSC